MRKLIILLIPLVVEAQNVSIGSWKDYQSYSSATYIAESKDKIFCVASEGLFYLDKEMYTINRLSKISGLSDVGVKQIAYSKNLDITIITYQNCNIDLLKDNTIINISDVKRKEITGIKSINNITILSKTAYLSTSFGLILVDLEKEEIKDTYQVGENNNIHAINGCAIKGDSIIIASSNGIYIANRNEQNLADASRWKKLTEYDGRSTYDNIISSDLNIYADTSKEINSISYNNSLYTSTTDSLIIIKSQNNDTLYLTHPECKNIRYSLVDNNNNIWVADSISGLLKFENFEYEGNYTADGPISNNIYSLELLEEKLYQCHGGHSNFGTNSLIKNGVSIKDKYDEWVNYDYDKLGNAIDILEVAVKNGVEYYASWYHGIPKMSNGKLIRRFNHQTTNGVLDTAYYSTNRIRISDLKFDNDGNLWGVSSEVNNPLFVKNNDDEWFSFTMNQNQESLFCDDLLIDSYNQKWGILARGKGIFVYTHNNTIEDSSDDQYKFLNTEIGSGNLPSLQTYSIAEDLNGEIWVGTDMGIGIFYNPNYIFTNSDYDAQQVIIQDGDYGQYLLSEEKIKCIVVDGANRKWIGTEKSGVFLLSYDGSDEILHFTAENSPLFSNNIVDLAINNESGEVFFGTEKGTISYRSDATTGAIVQKETHVFPNPVRQSYIGPIAIKGLVNNANVKIVDISNNLVFETYAKGGQALWSGNNRNGERASSGVYIVFSTDISGTEKAVSKILFVN
tara:strand:+ start:31 stop:2238 length:2208 start_codon:yes stop_codon:yes gene_type:complete